MHRIVAFVAGLIFAVGLGISGMTLPAKVIGFLDLFGSWDPSLAFVMAGAVGIYFAAFRTVRGYAAPVFGDRFRLPDSRDIDARLVGGAAMFGVGWGLAGYCPGPAITSVGAAATPALIFSGAMLVGMAIFWALSRVPSRNGRFAAESTVDS
jgi:hypothetical protein